MRIFARKYCLLADVVILVMLLSFLLMFSSFGFAETIMVGILCVVPWMALLVNGHMY